MSEIRGDKYVIMVNYGTEGWKPWGETNDWKDAVDKWKEAMGLGNKEVWIMKPVNLLIREID